VLKIVNSVDVIAAGRLLELLALNTPWHRSLWSVGIALSIAELLEACEAFQAGTLSEGTMRRLGSSCMRIAGKDPVLTTIEKSTVNELLRNIPRLDGVSFYALQQLRARIAQDYLLRWAGLFRVGSAYDPERAARCVAGYLLDSGFSETFLHGWMKSKIGRAQATEWTLGELCEEAHRDIGQRDPQLFDVLIAFKSSPRSGSGYPVGWHSASEVSDWLRANHFSVSGVRPSGGLILSVKARDAFGAGDAAVALADGYIARASIAIGQILMPLESVWVKGHAKPFPYQAKRRGVRVKALYREDQIFSNRSSSNVDAAIELLAHLENSSPAAAISAGWGAIEALLGEPGDRATAAESLAILVACSFPRAELTLLSHLIERTNPSLAPALKACKTNRDRAALVAQWIAQGDPIKLNGVSEEASVRRMRGLFNSPSATLMAMATSIADAFHRLYRQRNLILHGGITTSIALPHALRTSAKLVGAGIDRIAHGFYVQNLRPREIAARAKLSIAMVCPGEPVTCVDLLGE